MEICFRWSWKVPRPTAFGGHFMGVYCWNHDYPFTGGTSPAAGMAHRNMRFGKSSGTALVDTSWLAISPNVHNGNIVDVTFEQHLGLTPLDAYYRLLELSQKV